jgi:hypothetical protein
METEVRRQEWDNAAVDKVVWVFRGFEEADRANAREMAAMTPAQRIQIVIELRDRRHPNASTEGFARVYRVIKRERG